MLFNYLKVYVAEVRSVVSQTKDDDDALILSWSGARLASGQTSTKINFPAKRHRPLPRQKVFLNVISSVLTVAKA